MLLFDEILKNKYIRGIILVVNGSKSEIERNIEAKKQNINYLSRYNYILSKIDGVSFN